MEQLELDPASDVESALITRCRVEEKAGHYVLQGRKHTVMLTPLGSTYIAGMERIPFSNRSGHADSVTRIIMRTKTSTHERMISYRMGLFARGSAPKIAHENH